MEIEEAVVQTPPADSSPAASEKTPPADSSSAAEAGQDFEAADFETMSDAQRSEWLQTGKTPTKPAKAETTDGKAPGDGQPASESKPPKDGKPPASGSGKNRGEEPRVHQLLEERHRDRQKIQELEARLNGTGAKPAGTPPAAAAETKLAAAAEVKAPIAPKLEDFETWGEFIKAQNDHFEKLADFKAAQAVKADREQRAKETQDQTVADQNKAIEQSWKTRVNQSKTKHADFEAVALSPALGAVIPQGSVIDAYILESDNGAEILYALGQDLGEAERLAGLSPVKQAIELGKLEAKLGGAPAKTAASAAGVKHVSNASPPATELGNPKGKIADPVDQALEGKDFESYQAEMNARDIKARTGR